MECLSAIAHGSCLSEAVSVQWKWVVGRSWVPGSGGRAKHSTVAWDDPYSLEHVQDQAKEQVIGLP